ncbi:MAG: hypothetical protein ABJQ29_02070 [Luteolibacter sp.]
MKTKHVKRTALGIPKGMVAAVVCTMASIPSASFGQSADIFSDGKGSKSSGAQGSGDDLPEAAPVDSQPSRFAGEDAEAYIRARAAIFSMRNRVTDPFGLHQDPNVKPVVRNIVNNMPRRQSVLPPTPLAEIVKQIPVTTIMPSEKKFLVGVRTFTEGDEFPLVYRGKTLQIRITEVSAKQISFMNVESGESGTLLTGILPPGMVAGGGNSRPAGMISSNEDAPLDLGSAGAFNPEK